MMVSRPNKLFNGAALLVLVGCVFAAAGVKLSGRITLFARADTKIQNFLSNPTLDMSEESFTWVALLLLSSDSDVGRRSLAEYCEQVAKAMNERKLSIAKRQHKLHDNTEIKLYTALEPSANSLQKLAALAGQSRAASTEQRRVVARVLRNVQTSIEACKKRGFEPEPYRPSEEVRELVVAAYRKELDRTSWAMGFAAPGVILAIVGLGLWIWNLIRPTPTNA